MISSFAARAELVLAWLPNCAELFQLHAANRIDEHLPVAASRYMFLANASADFDYLLTVRQRRAVRV